MVCSWARLESYAHPEPIMMTGGTESTGVGAGALIGQAQMPDVPSFSKSRVKIGGSPKENSKMGYWMGRRSKLFASDLSDKALFVL